MLWLFDIFRNIFDNFYLAYFFRSLHLHIVKIDSRTQSFCLCLCVQNGLSYSGEETWPKLCLNRRQANSGVRSLGTNKHHLLHRIQAFGPSLIYNIRNDTFKLNCSSYYKLTKAPNPQIYKLRIFQKTN